MASLCSPPSPCGIECVTPDSSSHKYSEGEPQNVRTKGRLALPPSTRLNPLNIALREMRSYAPTPSIEVTAVRGFTSHNPWRTWAMHSHPAQVDSAYWCGDVAVLTPGPSCWAMVRATKRLNTSRDTIPRTPPSGLVRTVIRPHLTMNGNGSSGQVLAQSEQQMHGRHLIEERAEMLAHHARRSTCTPLHEERRFLPNSFSSRSKKNDRLVLRDLARKCFPRLGGSALSVCQLVQRGPGSWRHLTAFQGLPGRRELAKMHQLLCPFHAALHIVATSATTLPDPTNGGPSHHKQRWQQGVAPTPLSRKRRNAPPTSTVG